MSRTPGGVQVALRTCRSAGTAVLGALWTACGAVAVLAATANAASAQPGSFTLSSSAFADLGTYPTLYTCDGAGMSPPLAWANPPSGTRSFVLLMTTLPGHGETKWNWVVYNIPSTARGLGANAVGVGTVGAADNGAGTAYSPPCAKGPGAKTYTFTLLALSGNPALSATASANNGATVTQAIRSFTLGAAKLRFDSSVGRRLHCGGCQRGLQ